MEIIANLKVNLKISYFRLFGNLFHILYLIEVDKRCADLNCHNGTCSISESGNATCECEGRITKLVIYE